VIRYVVTRASFDGKSVVKLRIKEEWVFDREASRCILPDTGIAPLKTLYFQMDRSPGITPMFGFITPIFVLSCQIRSI
jgi:hypothetical protein